MRQDSQIIRPKTSFRLFCVALYIAGLAVLTIYLPFGISDRHRVWIVPCFVIFGAFWLAEVFLRRIVLGRDSIYVFSILDFQCRTIARIEIDSVTWHQDEGASLILRGGKEVGLPHVGRNPQGLTNTIRAWLKRTEVLL